MERRRLLDDEEEGTALEPMLDKVPEDSIQPDPLSSQATGGEAPDEPRKQDDDDDVPCILLDTQHTEIQMDTQPPPYEDDPPPAYDAGRQGPKSPRVAACIWWSWIGYAMLFHIGCLVVGVMFKDDCPIQKYIPIYQIVTGCFGLVRVVLEAWPSNSDEGQTKKTSTKAREGLHLLLFGFMLVWLIVGSVWLYRVYNDYQDEFPDKEGYCDAYIYSFTFGAITAQCIQFGLYLLFQCGMCVQQFARRKDTAPRIRNPPPSTTQRKWWHAPDLRSV